jgi:hypothetical protein
MCRPDRLLRPLSVVPPDSSRPEFVRQSCRKRPQFFVAVPAKTCCSAVPMVTFQGRKGRGCGLGPFLRAGISNEISVSFVPFRRQRGCCGPLKNSLASARSCFLRQFLQSFEAGKHPATLKNWGSLSGRDGFTQFGKTCISSPQFVDRMSSAYGADNRNNSSDDRMNDTKSHWVPVFAGGKYLCRLKKK